MNVAFLVLSLIFLSTSVKASLPALIEEDIYSSLRSQIETENKLVKGFFSTSAEEQKLYVDALWDSLDENITPTKLEVLNRNNDFLFSTVEKLRLGILKLKYKQAVSLEPDLLEELYNELRKPEADLKIIYIVAVHEKLLTATGHSELITLAKLHDSYSDISQETETDSEIQSEIVTDLYFNTPDTTTYMGGEYINSVKIFMFCRQNRLYPCLMVMRDINGSQVRKEDGSLWTNKALASAVTGLPSYQRNGNTPAGIFTIDSVMPEADQQLSYGKFRRMILNFIPKSKEEILVKSLIPQSSWASDWWKPTSVARDIGRNLFRIHGSGKINKDPNTPYFPFNRTHGCISQRENTYDGITYQDQRNLLDTVMTAMELKPTYENEPKIKGVLYIMELGDKNEPVTAEELANFGIK